MVRILLVAQVLLVKFSGLMAMVPLVVIFLRGIYLNNFNLRGITMAIMVLGLTIDQGIMKVILVVITTETMEAILATIKDDQTRELGMEIVARSQI